MKLREYCSTSKVSLSEIQRKADVAYTTVLKAAEGKLKRFDIAKRISEVTGGAVSIEEMCSGADEAGEAA